MAEIAMQNPRSEEIQSPLIAGITEGLNKLSKVLSLGTTVDTGLELSAVVIDSQELNQNRIYEAPLGKKLWLSTPEAVVKINGEVVQPTNTPFTIDYVGGSITFETQLLENDKVTVDVTRIDVSNSEVIATFTNEDKAKLDGIEANANNYDDTAIRNEFNSALAGKVNTEVGKGLYPTGKAVTDNNYSDADKAKVGTIDNKVEKQTGKGLSTEDFTTEDKAKLDGLSNYNDSSIREDIQSLQTGKSNPPKEFTVLLPSTSWSGTPLTQTVAVSGMVDDGLPLYDLENVTESKLKSFNKITALNTTTNSATFTAEFGAPTEDLNVRIVIVGSVK